MLMHQEKDTAPLDNVSPNQDESNEQLSLEAPFRGKTA